VYGLGRRQEHDPRSLKFPVEVADAPLKSKTWRCGPVLDQGDTSACTGFSRTADLMAWPAPAKFEQPDAFAADVYRLAQKLDEWTGEDYDGSSVLGALKAARELGFIGEFRWAFDKLDWLRSISQRGPSVVGTTWLNSMFRPDGRGLLTVDPSSGEAGGHAYLIRALYTTPTRQRHYVGEGRPGDTLLRIRNSWGHGWGVKGDAFMWASDYFAHLWPGGEQSVVTVALHR